MSYLGRTKSARLLPENDANPGHRPLQSRAVGAEGSLQTRSRRGRLAVAAPADLLLAAALSVFMILLVTVIDSSVDHNPHAGPLAAVVGLTMTIPVAWRRSAPVVAAAALAAGAVVNEFGVGAMVRCGPALPAVFLVGYALGRRERRWDIGLAGTALLAVSVFLQVHYDSQIRHGGIPASLGLCAIVIASWLAGRLLRSRARLVRSLRLRTEELLRQRDDNARLVVATEREHIASELHRAVGHRLSEVINEVSTACRSVTAEPDRTREAFARIEQTARRALGQMRRTVGALLADPAPTRPAPVLTELSRLVEQRSGRTRLVVDGDLPVLTEGLELSGHRIVEGLLNALHDGPADGVEVTVRFTAEMLEISVKGRPTSQVAFGGALAAARERARLYRGTLQSAERDGVWETVARLPIGVSA